MSHEHRNRLTDYLSSDPTKKTEAGSNGITNFEENYSGVKNVCFVLLDGKHIFLNYNYLVAGEFFPEENKIILHFTTHVISLTGQKLEYLYQDLMQHFPKIIITINDRYSTILQKDNSIITKVELQCLS